MYGNFQQINDILINFVFNILFLYLKFLEEKNNYWYILFLIELTTRNKNEIIDTGSMTR